MQNWRELYESRKMSADEAATHIRSGDRVVVGHGPANPFPLLDAIAKNKDAYQGVSFHHMVTHGGTPYVGPEMLGHFETNPAFVGSTHRGALEAGFADFSPIHFSDVPDWLEKVIDSNVVVCVCSPPDDHGYVCFGLGCDYTVPAAMRSRTIIVEVNSNCPTVFGDTFMHVSEIECFVESDRPLIETKSNTSGSVECQIAGYCAEIIKDGDTLQMGVGGIPDAVLTGLTDKKDLGIHSEIIGDGVQLLMEVGVITGRKKTLHPRLVISSGVFSTSKFHRFAHKHPAIMLYSIAYTNDVRVIAQNKNMVAINSCVQVDMTGQVNAEYLAGGQFSGVGGQVDFVRGAKLSEGGRSIITCGSTAKSGTMSRIVPHLDHGAAVTTLRTDVDFVVSEYGIAHLGGRSVVERARALVKIAHPKFRDELQEEIERRYSRKLYLSAHLPDEQ